MKKTKKMIRIVTIVTIVAILFNISIMISSRNVLAQTPYITNQVKLDEEYMGKDVLYQYFQMDTRSDVTAASTVRDVYTYTLKQTSDTQLATWTYSKADNYALVPLTEIAKDYEKNHPGWIVLGGVNAEGYYNGELTNAFVQDYDVIRKDVSAEAFKELIGFKEDGSVVIKQVPVSSDTPRLKVDDKSFDVSKVNELPEENGISIILPDLIGSLDLSNYHVIEGTYSLLRRSKEFPSKNKTHSGSFYGIFVKGTINIEILDKANISAPKNRKFYIVTENEEVVNHLTTGKEIKCQFDYIDEFSDVKSMVGYMYKYLEDGVTIPQSFVDINDMGEKVKYDCDYFKTISKERCGIGFKEDGTIVLLTTNTKTGGPTQYEVGEMFRELGCVNAYQFDGGGSVTFLKRTETGEIKMLNTPGDGSPRAIMSGLFIVTRDPLFNLNSSKTTAETITLDLKQQDFVKDITDIKVKLNEKEYLVKDNQVVISGLEENTKYELTVTYKTKDNINCTSSMYVTTKTYDPGIDINPTSKGFIIGLRQSKENLITSKIVIDVDGEKYQIDNVDGTKTEYIINDLFKGETYKLTITYEVTNKGTKQTYTREIETKEYQTLSYNIPELIEFNVQKRRGKINVTFDYEDKDNLITKINLIDNGKEIALEKGSKSYSIEDDSKAHKIQLQKK